MPLVLSPRRRRQKKVNRKIYVFPGIVLTVLIALGFLLFGAGIFDVRDIEITGADDVTAALVKNAVNSYLDEGFLVKKRANVFLAGGGKLKKNILDSVYKVKDADVNILNLHGLAIEVLQKEPKGIYCAGRCFYFDSEKIVYEKAPRTKGFLLLSILDQRSVSLSEGDKISDGGLFDSMYEADRFFDELLDLRIQEYVMSSSSFEEFAAVTEENWIVYMGAGNIQRQVENLKIFLESQFNESRDSLVYVDTRLEDRVYYEVK